MADDPHITVKLDGDATSIEFPTEGLTASATVTRIGERLYRLDSVPMFTELAAFGDVIEAEPIADAIIRFRRVVTPSNWRVFDFVLPRETVEGETLKQVLARAERVGAHWERVFGGVLYICVPPEVDWDPTTGLAG
jgi:hypothetical protein